MYYCVTKVIVLKRSIRRWEQLTMIQKNPNKVEGKPIVFFTPTYNKVEKYAVNHRYFTRCFNKISS